VPLQLGTKPPVTYRSFAFRARALPWGTAVARALFDRNPFFTGQGELARCRVISGEPSRNKTDRRSLPATPVRSGPPRGGAQTECARRGKGARADLLRRKEHGQTHEATRGNYRRGRLRLPRMARLPVSRSPQGTAPVGIITRTRLAKSVQYGSAQLFGSSTTLPVQERRSAEDR
jgi:hypothetical protein